MWLLQPTFCSLFELTQLLFYYLGSKAFDTDLICAWMRVWYELKIKFKSPKSPKSQTLLPISEEENWLKTERQEQPQSSQSAAATKQTQKCWLYLISFVIRKKICPSHKLDTFINFGNIHIDTPRKGNLKQIHKKGNIFSWWKLMQLYCIQRAELHWFKPSEDHIF